MFLILNVISNEDLITEYILQLDNIKNIKIWLKVI